MKNKKTPFFIAATKSAAKFTAMQGLKLNDKTLRLKNVRISETSFKLKNIDIPAVQVMADTDMQTDASMIVGYSKEHANIPTPTTKNLTPSEFAKRAGIVGKIENNSGISKLIPVNRKIVSKEIKTARRIDLGPKMKAAAEKIKPNGIYFRIVENDPAGPKICIVRATGPGARPTTFAGVCLFDNSWLKEQGQASGIWDPTAFTEISALSEIFQALGKCSLIKETAGYDDSGYFIRTDNEFHKNEATKIIKTLTILKMMY